MNSLSVRVSSVKTTENSKKNAEMRNSIVSIPTNLKSSKSILEKFLVANSIPEQISVVKEIYISKIYSLDEKIEFLSELYFNTPLKHPVRNQCSKLIQENFNEELVINKLKAAIIGLLNSNQNFEICPVEKLNLAINSLSGCFENFHISKRALKQCLKDVSNYIYNSIPVYLKQISLETSPSVKNELYLYLHNSVRVILSCIQEFLVDFEDSLLIDITFSLNVIAIDLIKDIYMPMDTKTNIGILLAYIAQIHKKYNEWINDIIYFQPIYSEKYLNNCYQLCACIGIINSIKGVDIDMNLNGFLQIIEKICCISNQHSSESSILLAGTRSLLQFLKIFLRFHKQKELNEISTCCQTLLSFTFCHFDHHMDSMRHLTKDLLKNILEICKKYEINIILDQIHKYCTEEDSSLLIKCILISNVAKVYGTQDMIAIKYKNIYENFFTDENFKNDLNVANCFESIMVASYSEMDLKNWQHTYLNFLIEKINQTDIHHKYIYENLLNKCVKLAPESIEYLFKNKSNDLELNIKLSILCTMRKNKLKNNSHNLLADNISDLNKAFVNNSDDTKISALKLLTETHKTTEELTELECKSLLFFLKYNSNCQSPSTRQKILGLSLNALTRFDINLKKIIKTGRHENESRKLHFYFIFLKDLIKLLCENLFEGANYSRRYVSLELLKNSLEIVRDNKLNFNNFIPKKTLNTIFAHLNDSYEINKNLALDILKIFIYSKYGHFIAHKSQFINLVTSIKPTDSITAAYYLEFYCYMCNVEEFKNIFQIKSEFLTPQYNPIKYCAIKMVINILNSGLSNGKVSILLAAANNPLYGCLFAIRHIMSNLDFDKLCQEEIWRTLISEIIVLGKIASEIVEPIVNSSSPEGHFPNDSNLLSKDNINNIMIQSNNNELICNNMKFENFEQLTPQIVLVCAWRTIKEVSLILGELTERSPIKKNNLPKTQDYLLTNEQILEIGEYFKQLLSETKHRGAFEQAYVGFTKLCSRLWRIDQPELNVLPMQWLMELIDIISKHEKINEKICATRRSAGVPFMVQALITSELQVGTTKALKKCIKLLFEICNSKEHSTESKTHSLNILRALFRCTDLNEVCNEYIEEGIISAIQGYNGSTWSERNSSTLLFSSLITRIFGVQKTKDTESLNIRNKMTGRIFFLRYPELFDFFLKELEIAKKQIENNQKPNKLHPLLIILSRLYPSTLEGSESHLKLSMFISYISPCSASKELQTRILIGKAIVAFTPVNLMEERINVILNIIKEQFTSKNELNSNYLHGLLLQIFLLLKSIKQKCSTLMENIITDLLHYENVINLNPVIMKTIFDIFIEILKEKPDHLIEIIKKLKILKNSLVYNNSSFSKYYVTFRKSFSIFKLRIDLINSSEFINTEKYWENQLNFSKNGKEFILTKYEEVQTYLNIILLILFKKPSNINNVIEEFEFDNYEKEFVNTLTNTFIDNSIQYLTSSSILESIIQNIMELNKLTTINLNPELIKCTFAILSHLNYLNYFNIKELIDLSTTYSNDLQFSIALMNNSLIEKNKIIVKENQFEILEYIKNISQPWNNFYLRLTSAVILKHLFDSIIENIQCENEKFIIEFSSLVLSLLMDDDTDVKENISKHVTEFSSKYSKKYDNVVSTFAQRIFIEEIVELLTEYSNYNKLFVRRILIEIMKTLEGKNNINEKSENNDFEIFDKNEINIYAEPRQVYLDCSEIFNEKFLENL